MSWVCRDISCPFPDLRPVQSLDEWKGQSWLFSLQTSFFCSSLDLSCFVADPNHTVMNMHRTDWIMAVWSWPVAPVEGSRNYSLCLPFFNDNVSVWRHCFSSFSEFLRKDDSWCERFYPEVFFTVISKVLNGCLAILPIQQTRRAYSEKMVKINTKNLNTVVGQASPESLDAAIAASTTTEKLSLGYEYLRVNL